VADDAGHTAAQLRSFSAYTAPTPDDGRLPLMQSMCPICRHSQRSAIDEHLRAGRELRSLVDEFGLRTPALLCTDPVAWRLSAAAAQRPAAPCVPGAPPAAERLPRAGQPDAPGPIHSYGCGETRVAPFAHLPRHGTCPYLYQHLAPRREG
jgi:hypothetical protein